MKTEYILVGIFSILMLFAILCYDRINHKLQYKKYVLLKMIASGLFLSCSIFAVAFTFFKYDSLPIYKILILIGCFLGFAGDFLLALVEKKGEIMFIGGVFSFAIDQILLIIASFFILQFNILDIIITAVIIIIITLIIKLGKLKINKQVFIPVVFYIILISLTLAKAISIFYFAGKPTLAHILFSIGASLFVFSDFILGINKFGKRNICALDSLNTFTYFPGQLLIALSLFFV